MTGDIGVSEFCLRRWLRVDREEGLASAEVATEGRSRTFSRRISSAILSRATAFDGGEAVHQVLETRPLAQFAGDLGINERTPGSGPHTLRRDDRSPLGTSASKRAP